MLCDKNYSMVFLCIFYYLYNLCSVLLVKNFERIPLSKSVTYELHI